MKIRSKITLFVVATMLLVVFQTQPAIADVSFSVQLGLPMVEVQCAPHHVWVEACYHRVGPDYIWVPGHWEQVQYEPPHQVIVLEQRPHQHPVVQSTFIYNHTDNNRGSDHRNKHNYGHSKWKHRDHH